MSLPPLTERDYQNLSATLSGLHAQNAMSLERLDGFFAALVAGPEPIRPGECLPAILGDAFDDEDAFPSAKSLENFVSLLLRHWLEIADTLRAEQEFHPWLEADEDGTVHGREWARGFCDGMQLLNEDWGLLFDDEEEAPALVPIMALAFEQEPDDALHDFVAGADDEQRQAWVASLSTSVAAIHRFFVGIRQQLEDEAGDDA
ncbi:UPF0149 family protein [Paludibacterium yongneupense]|uniref:UPF0149 family protein n=1 Tax=Paludibacterium yongneupense TaxID=400061 RepID=UPI0004112540|nr:UPF0149 family protein [Paludibacterium yongneupense]